MIDKLEYLLALARERNFGRAAEQCGVTQPTFSAGIKQLEDTLGVMLVQRTSRFLGFTAEGERVLDWARGIVADTRAMRAEVQTLKKGLSGHLKIAAIPTALAMVSTLTTPFRAKHPNVKFTVLSRTSAAALSMLENPEGDAVLPYTDTEPLGRMRAVPLYLEQYRLLTSESSPLGDRDKVSWAEVAKIPLCLLTPDMQSDVILVIGANPTDAHPVFASRMKKRLRQGAKLIVIDPRLTDLVRTPHIKADYHLPLRPGTNAAMLNALAHVIVTERLVNEAFVREFCDRDAF